MDDLNRAFEQAIADTVTSAVVSLITDKFLERGVRLSLYQASLLRKTIAAQDYSNIRVPSWKFWKQKAIALEITKQDLDALERSLEKILEHLPSTIEGATDDLAASVLAQLKHDWPKQAWREDKAQRGFSKRLAKQWSKPLNLLALMLTIATEFGSTQNSRMRQTAKSPLYKTDVLTRLHARACQVAREVLLLLRGGFSDGAMARWRTLHETAVTSLFISAGDEELAERYALHHVCESLRAARTYQEHAARLGLEAIHSDEMQALAQAQNQLERRFGPDYRSEYGWAANKLAIKAPKFTDVERAVGIDHFRPYFKMASQGVHSNPKGVFFRLGLLEETDILLAGASNFGLADPGQNTAISLSQVTSTLANLDATIDGIVTLKMLIRLCDEAGKAFVRTQADVEAIAKADKVLAAPG